MDATGSTRAADNRTSEEQRLLVLVRADTGDLLRRAGGVLERLLHLGRASERSLACVVGALCT